MFDFSKMDQAFAAMGELDGLLRSILAEQRTTNMLLAMQLSTGDGLNLTERDRMAGAIVQDASSIANGPDART